MENEDYIKKWLEDSLNDEERRVFERTEDYRALARLSKSLMSFKAPEYDVHVEYGRLRSARHSKAKVVTMNWLIPFLRIAAVFMLMAGSYFFFLYEPATVVETLATEKIETRLPDSSFVVLNALSRLSFHEKKWQKERKVKLEGEAFFKVAKGSRFDVETSSGTISVLGTEFNVVNRKDYFEVICYEGSVQVQSSQHVVKLLPKQMFRMVGGVVNQDITQRSDGPDWVTGESSFQSVPFLLVVREFERQYNVKVTTTNVDVSQRFTGTFTHSDMSMALRSISIPLNLTYQVVEDKKVVLKGGIE
jgi:transmembrane sensor